MTKLFLVDRLSHCTSRGLVRGVDALAEAGPEPILVEGVRAGEEDARWIVEPLRA